MALNCKALLEREFPVVRQTLTDRDCILYALSLGLGRDPMNLEDLPYVFEKDLRVFPTMPVVLGHPGNWLDEPEYEITKKMLVHGSQRLRNYKPLPLNDVILGENEVINIIDKGAERGAIMITTRRLRQESTGDILAEMESALFCRADGGLSNAPEKPIYEFRCLPDREPDASIDIPTEPNAAFLYRLNSDRNPLHADPEIAIGAGFKRPILHGLCTFGLAGVAIHKTYAKNGFKTIGAIETRFSQIVYPGETVTFDLWRDGNEISYRAMVKSRESKVLDFGRAELV